MEYGRLELPGLSPEEVFADISRRRTGIVKALTTEVEEFYRQCSTKQVRLCLYGLPSENWKVYCVAEYVPTEFPEPVEGINFMRDNMPRNEWLAKVAAHSDSWLIALSFFYAIRWGFDRAKKNYLFSLVNDEPTILEIVQASIMEEIKKGNKSKPISTKKWVPMVQKRWKRARMDEDGALEKNDENEEENWCRVCGDEYMEGEFWICCDTCQKWFHGECVMITHERAEHIDQYECPLCIRRKLRTA